MAILILVKPGVFENFGDTLIGNTFSMVIHGINAKRLGGIWYELVRISYKNIKFDLVRFDRKFTLLKTISLLML